MAFYTKAEMLTQVRAMLNETTALFWTDTELVNYLNMGARTISGVTLCTPVSDILSYADASAGYVDGTLSTTMSVKFIKITSVTTMLTSVAVPTHLQRLDIRNFGHGAPAATATNQTPKWYYIFGDRIFAWPTPKGTAVANSSGGNITVYGYRAAWDYDHGMNEATAGAGVDIPISLQPRLIDFVLACAYVKAGKYSLTGFHMTNFMQNCMFDRKDVFESNQIVDSLDRFNIPDRTQVAQ